eukprot:gene10496-biopygen246
MVFSLAIDRVPSTGTLQRSIRDRESNRDSQTRNARDEPRWEKAGAGRPAGGLGAGEARDIKAAHSHSKCGEETAPCQTPTRCMHLPVLLLVAPAPPLKAAVAAAVWCVRELPRASDGTGDAAVLQRTASAVTFDGIPSIPVRVRNLWGVGGYAARRGVASGGGPFFHEFSRGALISSASREFAPRCEPHPARAKCGPMIRMSSGSSLAFQRLSRDTLKSILNVTVGGNAFPGRTLRSSIASLTDGTPP